MIKNISSPSSTRYNATKICNLHFLARRQASPLLVDVFALLGLLCFCFFRFCSFVVIDYKQEFGKKKKNIDQGPISRKSR